jgi:hypothetical protein
MLSSSTEFRRLLYALRQEHEPAKRQEIVTQMLDHIQARWERLFRRLYSENRPERLAIYLAQLDEVLEARKDE